MEISHCLMVPLVGSGIVASIAIYIFGCSWLRKHCRRHVASTMMLTPLIGAWGLFMFQARSVPCRGDDAVARTVNEAIEAHSHDRIWDGRSPVPPCECSTESADDSHSLFVQAIY